MMETGRVLLSMGLCLLVVQVSSQTFSFPNLLIVDEQSRNWSTEISVKLSDNDLIVFQPKVNIQTCSDVCTIDLSHCSQEKAPVSSDACYCTEKNQEYYRIHVGSKAKWSDSGRLLEATIPSREIFGSISATSLIGIIPFIPKETVRADATYQLAEGRPIDLLRVQNVSVCPNKYVPIKICVENKRPGAILRVNLDDQELKTDSSCIRFVETYDFVSSTHYKLIFTYEVSTRISETDMSVIYLQQNNRQCPSAKPTTTIPKTTVTTTKASTHGQNLDDEFFDVFSSQSRDWRLVFRGTPSVNKSVISAYTNRQKISVESGCKRIFSNDICTNHYRNNNAMNHWTNINQVALVVFKEKKIVAYVVFDAIGSNFQNWLRQDRIVNSSWSDLKTQSINYFSLEGHARLFRRFFVNKKYGGCSGDNGWFVAVDRSRVPCPWEKNQGYPTILYAKSNTSTNWLTGNKGVADYFAVFIKYNVYEEGAEYFDIFGSNKQDWRVAFRGTSGINKSVSEAYFQKQQISVEPGCKNIYGKDTCSNHYRNNDVLDNWSDIHQVAFLVFKGHNNVAHIVFDAVGSDSKSWFSQEKIVNSSWSDLKTQSTNFFSLEGDARLFRRFFVNKKYGGCSRDNGWFVAVDRSDVPCSWETNGGYPKFVYATKNNSTTWETGDADVADYIAIFVKYF